MISVIIGTDNNERALVPTLSTLVSGAAAGLIREVIIADGGSTDATVAVADLAGCEAVVLHAPLGARLKEAAARSRAPWLMFLQPGVMLDTGWMDETTRFIEQADLAGSSDTLAAVFRRSAPLAAKASPLREGLSMIKLALFGRPSPTQGLLILRRLYDRLGGHRGDDANTETDLLGRLGRKRTVTLRTGAVKVIA